MTIQFCNVDLDIELRIELKDLERELDGRVVVLHEGPVSPGCFTLRLETGTEYDNADDTILAFCSILKTLSPRGKQIWRSAHKKEFNIGYEIDRSQRITEFSLQSETVERIGSLGASIGVTLYCGFTTSLKTPRVKRKRKGSADE